MFLKGYFTNWNDANMDVQGYRGWVGVSTLSVFTAVNKAYFIALI